MLENRSQGVFSVHLYTFFIAFHTISRGKPKKNTTANRKNPRRTKVKINETRIQMYAEHTLAPIFKHISQDKMRKTHQQTETPQSKHNFITNTESSSPSQADLRPCSAAPVPRSACSIRRRTVCAACRDEISLFDVKKIYVGGPASAADLQNSMRYPIPFFIFFQVRFPNPLF